MYRPDVSITPADIRNWMDALNHLLKITWIKYIYDWEYFYLIEVDKEGQMIRLEGASNPDGSTKHRGDKFWVMMYEIRDYKVIDNSSKSDD